MRGLYGGVHVWGTCSLTGKFWARHFSAKLFVGGLSYDTNEPVLKAAFEKHGDILEVKVICDHKSGRSKGYGFVHFTSEAAAADALKEIDGQVVSLYWMGGISGCNLHTRDNSMNSRLIYDLVCSDPCPREEHNSLK